MKQLSMLSSRSELSGDPSPSHTQPHQTSNGDKDTEDFFGGMVVGRSRRRKVMDSTAGSSTPPNESVVSLPIAKATSSISETQAEAPVTTTSDAKAFYMRVDLPMHELRDEEEDPRHAEMRERLVRFYEAYNPSKLSEVESTLHAFLGRDKELFAQLVKQYGPEPRVLRANVLPQWGDCKARGGHSEVGSAFDFITGAQPNTAIHSTWSNDNGGNNAPVAANGGFSFIESAALATGGFNTFANVFPDSEGAIGVIDAAAVVSAKVRETPTSGGPVADDERHGNDLYSDVQDDTHNAIQDDTHNDIQDDTHNAIQDDTHGDIQDDTHNDIQDDIHDSEVGETVWDRHRRELDDAHAAVLSARTSLAGCVESLCTAVTDRRSAVASLRAIAEEMERAVSREAFAEADALSGAHARALSAVSALDAAPQRLAASIASAADSAESSVLSLAALLERHRRELCDTRDEEERRAQRVISAAAFRLETQAEGIAAAVARAEREEAHAHAEVERLRTRRGAAAERVAEESRALHEARERLDGDIALLEQERAALEARLSEVAAALEERRGARQEADAQLQHVLADATALERDVEGQIAEEEQRLQAAARDAGALRCKHSDIAREEEAFAQRRDALLAELRDSDERCNESERRAEALRTESAAELRAFVHTAVLAVIEQRAVGAGVLLEPIDLEDADEEAEEDCEAGDWTDLDSGEAASPLGAVRRLERLLCALDTRESRRAAAASAVATESAELRARLSLLDAAKRAAAAGRRFREAQLKADEAHAAARRLDELDALQRRAAEAAETRARRRAALRKRIAEAREGSAARVEAFLAKYRSAVDAAGDAAPPDLLRLPADSSDGLREAGRRLAAALREELDEACERIRAEMGEVKEGGE